MVKTVGWVFVLAYFLVLPLPPGRRSLTLLATGHKEYQAFSLCCAHLIFKPGKRVLCGVVNDFPFLKAEGLLLFPAQG